MIVSFEHRFVFVKGVKVGGSSVEVVLSAALEESAVVAPSNFDNPTFRPRNYHDESRACTLTNHATAQDARAFVGAGPFESMRRALIIRNPFEKVRSFFYFKLGKGVEGMTIDRAIEDCSSEATRALAEDGRSLITDILFYERLEEDLAAFLADVGVPFSGRLDVFEKSWQRKAYGHIPVIYSVRQQSWIREKFAFEFACYAEAGHVVSAGAVEGPP